LKQKLVVVVGPTSSGKSDLAVQLAKKFRGEIVSADSRQVYRELDIASGKITKKEMSGIPHYLLDVAGLKQRFTVIQYRTEAKRAIDDISKRGHIPFLVGGTGFYIQVVIDNLAIPEVPSSRELREKFEKESIDELFAKLEKLDPRRAKTIERKNKRRLIRALEIIYATEETVPPLRARDSSYDILMVGITYTKEALKKRIALRLKNRFEEGMIGEIRRLHEQDKVSWKRLEELGLECRWIARYLQGKVTENEMKERLQKDIEHFAKRQITWLKKEKRIYWISPENSKKESEKLVLEFLGT